VFYIIRVDRAGVNITYIGHDVAPDLFL
jgi:hypothetical protein